VQLVEQLAQRIAKLCQRFGVCAGCEDLEIPLRFCDEARARIDRSGEWRAGSVIPQDVRSSRPTFLRR
jgi:hypothetical protein